MDSESDSGSEEVEMPSKLIDGNAIAARIRQEIADEVVKLGTDSTKYGEPVVPGLAVILSLIKNAIVVDIFLQYFFV